MTRYSVVQYVSDVDTHEAINIGVLAFDESETRVAFLRDWKRVRQFASGKSIRFLSEFAGEVIDDPGAWSPERIEAASRSWGGSIQLSRPAFSRMPVESLFNDAIRNYLKEPVHQTSAEYTKPGAVTRAYDSLIGAVERVTDIPPGDVVKKKIEVVGRQETHVWDVGLQNGHILLVIQGMSFRGSVQDSIRDQQVGAAAFSIEDVRNQTPNLPIGIVAWEPLKPSKPYDRAVQLFGRLGASLISAEEVDQWSYMAVEELPIAH